MGTRVKFDILPEIVSPKLDDLDVTTISFEDMLPLNIAFSTSDAKRPDDSGGNQNALTKGYNWRSWSFNLSLSNIQGLAKFVKNLLVELNRINQQIIQLLKIVRFFNSDLKSIAFFLKFLLKQLVKQLKQLIDSLASTGGIYVSIVWPIQDRTQAKYTIPIYGGFQEFIKRVNYVCLNSSDPDAPKFREDKDKVGGVIIAMLGGTEDPEFLDNLFHNYKVLSQFFGLESHAPNPPKNFKVTAGIYKNRANNQIYQPGVLLSWEAPTTPVTGYVIFRAKDVKGVVEAVILKDINSKSKENKDKTVTIHIPDRKEITIVKHVIGKSVYKYYDFSAGVDTTYYYKIYSIVGDNYLKDNPLYRDVKSPIATQFLAATPKACVNPKEIEKYTSVGINGEILDPFIDLAGDWYSFSVRTMIGKPLDDAFRKLDALADKLSKYVDTAGNTMSAYLKFLGQRIERLLDIMNSVEDTIDRIDQFNVRGTFMVLELYPKEGGMYGFMDRFNEACQTSNAETGLKTGSDNPFAVDRGGGIAQYDDKGIMFGLILLYGFVDPKDERLLDYVPKHELAAVKRDMKQTETAIGVLLEMLGLKKKGK